jgi:hypothetical protein
MRTAIERARALFTEAGLAFPAVPETLGEQLVEKGPWLFSTREHELGNEQYVHPYWLSAYVDEGAEGTDEYAVLAHGGHGVNSYAIQYYLVYENLRLFLHLGWGGVYMDSQDTAEQIRECFRMADEIVAAVQSGVESRTMETLTIVGSDFYGSYWYRNKDTPQENEDNFRLPIDVLREALQWLSAR